MVASVLFRIDAQRPGWNRLVVDDLVSHSYQVAEVARGSPRIWPDPPRWVSADGAPRQHHRDDQDRRSRPGAGVVVAAPHFGVGAFGPAWSFVHDTFEAVIEVKLLSETPAAAFEAALRHLPQVVSATLMTGSFDYAVRVACVDRDDLVSVTEALRQRTGVRETYTRLLLREVRLSGP